VKGIACRVEETNDGRETKLALRLPQELALRLPQVKYP